MFTDWRNLQTRAASVGVSLEDFAAMVPCHINTLYLWRSGKVRPTPENATRVSALLETLERQRLTELLNRYPQDTQQ